MSRIHASTCRLEHTMVFIVAPVIDFYKHFGNAAGKKKSFPICYINLEKKLSCVTFFPKDIDV